jgi:formate dehydrogenase iron-sulfur subunit
MSKGFFIDTTRCTACKGCQVACKQWNDLPVEKTENQGNLQNPPDLSSRTYKLVRMKEEIIGGKLKWLFFPDQCRHCLTAPCLLWAQDTEAIYQDEDTGAVVYTSATRKLKAEDIIGACPYDVPRSDASGTLAKCTMCNDRVKKGLEPACVKTCPTGALNFGNLEEMRALALERLEKAKSTYPNARLIDPDAVRVIFLTAFAPEKYHPYAAAFDRKAWKKTGVGPR